MCEELINIIEVITLSRDSDVNTRLKQGWRLLKVYTECYDTMEPGLNHQSCYFVLGRPSAIAPFVPDAREQLGTFL